MEQKEGWFDDKGWDVDAAVDESAAWFTEPAPGGGRRKAPMVIGKGKPWSQLAWRESADLWRAHGAATGLIVPPATLGRLREQAGLSENAPDPGALPPDLPPDQMADRAVFVPWRAASALFYLNQNRHVTNFPYYLALAEAEQQPATVAARKTLWEADLARRAGNKLEAARLYEAGLNDWKKVLLANPGFHRSERFERTEEETYEMELDYLRMIAQDDPRVRAKAQDEYTQVVNRVGLLLPLYAAAPPSLPPGNARQEWYSYVAEKYFSPFSEPMPANLTDGRNNTPWVRDHIKEGVLIRQGVPRRSTAAQYAAMQQAGGPPAPGAAGGPP